MIRLLSSVAGCLDGLLAALACGIRVVVALNSAVVSCVVWLVSATASVLAASWHLAAACVSALVADSGLFLDDLFARLSFAVRFLRGSASDACAAAVWAASLAASTVSSSAAATASAAAYVVSVPVWCVVRLGDLVAHVVTSLVFAFELVAFVCRLAAGTCAAAVVAAAASTFGACRAVLAAAFSSALAVHAGCARLGRDLTFGLVSGVKGVPCDAVLGLCVVAGVAWLARGRVDRLRAAFVAAHRWRRLRDRSARIWRKVVELTRLVLATVEFRDGASDFGDDDGEQLDLLSLDDGENSVFSLGGLSRRSASVVAAAAEQTSSGNQGVCVICQVEPKTIALLPCRHVCLCDVCRRLLLTRRSPKKCPVCRGTIRETMKLYL